MNRFQEIETKSKLIKRVTLIISYCLLLGYWIFILLAYNYIPQEIPIHFNGSGEVDAYGSKKAIFHLPILATLIVFMLEYFSANPNNFNFAVEITEDNAQEQYRNASKLLQTLKFGILILFIYIDYQTIRVSFGKTEGLGTLFVPIIFCALILPVIYFNYKSYKNKKYHR